MREEKPLSDQEKEKLLEIVESVLVGSFITDVEDKFLTWQINDYEIRKGFPQQLGLKLYNETLRKLVYEGKKAVSSWRNQEEERTVLSEFERHIQNLRAMIDRAIYGEEATQEDIKQLQEHLLHQEFFRFTREAEKGRFVPRIFMQFPRLHQALWRWIYYVWEGHIKVKRCKANDCNKILIPKRSDQHYCSIRCYNRAYMRARRAPVRKNDEPDS